MMGACASSELVVMVVFEFGVLGEGVVEVAEDAEGDGREVEGGEGARGGEKVGGEGEGLEG